MTHTFKGDPLNDDHYDSSDDQIADLKAEVARVTENIAAYLAIHDGLSDMIESGRLIEASIPDDYQWLVEALAALANVEPEPKPKYYRCNVCEHWHCPGEDDQFLARDLDAKYGVGGWEEVSWMRRQCLKQVPEPAPDPAIGMPIFEVVLDGRALVKWVAAPNLDTAIRNAAEKWGRLERVTLRSLSPHPDAQRECDLIVVVEEVGDDDN